MFLQSYYRYYYYYYLRHYYYHYYYYYYYYYYFDHCVVLLLHTATVYTTRITLVTVAPRFLLMVDGKLLLYEAELNVSADANYYNKMSIHVIH